MVLICFSTRNTSKIIRIFYTEAKCGWSQMWSRPPEKKTRRKSFSRELYLQHDHIYYACNIYQSQTSKTRNSTANNPNHWSHQKRPPHRTISNVSMFQCSFVIISMLQCVIAHTFGICRYKIIGNWRWNMYGDIIQGCCVHDLPSRPNTNTK